MEADTGTDYEGFKIPSSIPQDILLIQDLVGPIVPSAQAVTPSETDSVDSIDSSGESTDSVEEVEANLISEDVESTRCVLQPELHPSVVATNFPFR
jgi:H/ACA ribonucleoprotein complex non-core subunit NAF1